MLSGPDALETRKLLWFGHACSGYRTLWEHARYYGLGMDALGTVGSGNTIVILVRAWMLWFSDALRTRTFLSPSPHPTPQRKAQKPRKTGYGNLPLA